MAKRRNQQALRAIRRRLWVERTVAWSGLDTAQVERILATPRTQSLRLNPLRTGAVPDAWLTQPISWCPDGFRLSADPAAYDDLARSGRVYIQNAASWLPVLALAPQPGERILDLCAAPGGKASHIQAITDNQARLVCNDNSRPRLIRLRANLERLGVRAECRLGDATRLGRRDDIGLFDKILLDAPCSGEGMMSLRPQDSRLFDSWSPAQIHRLASLQKRLILEAWRALRPGGRLVYSTCTMAPEENEAVVAYLLRRQTDASLLPIKAPRLTNRTPALQAWHNRQFGPDLSACLRLLPGDLTEAFFVAVIGKE